MHSLQFRRQFLLANAEVAGLENWNHERFDSQHLYSHPCLEVTVTSAGPRLLILLGYMFDPREPANSNKEILAAVATRVETFSDLLCALKGYAGRYVVIFRSPRELAVVHDPLGLREVYYLTRPNRVICGSQPNLVSQFSSPVCAVTSDEGILHFHREEMKSVRHGRLWVGDETYYDGVRHLLPNHYLDVGSLVAKRYWPAERLELLELQDAVRQTCDYLVGILRAVTLRHPVMMAVTAGLDSRSLLAASRCVRDRIYYFINMEPPLTPKSADVRIPIEMCAVLGIPFHLHEVNGSVDPEFRRIFVANTFLSSDRILPTIYNVYYKSHQHRVNLLGVGEIGRDYYGDAPSEVDGYYLAHKLKFLKSKYATAQCAKWLAGARAIAESNNVDLMKLFLWEMLLGNWGAVGNSESDIAIEEFDPYDSHFVYELMLSVDRKHTRGEVPEFFRAVYRQLWPELLQFPLNPPDTLTESLRALLKRLRFYGYLQKGKYLLDRWRFHDQAVELAP